MKSKSSLKSATSRCRINDVRGQRTAKKRTQSASDGSDVLLMRLCICYDPQHEGSGSSCPLAASARSVTPRDWTGMKHRRRSAGPARAATGRQGARRNIEKKKLVNSAPRPAAAVVSRMEEAAVLVPVPLGTTERPGPAGDRRVAASSRDSALYSYDEAAQPP